MTWIDLVNKRGLSSKLFQSDVDPHKFSLDTQAGAAWHFAPNPGDTLAEVNCIPRRILPGELPGRWATFNGWIVQDQAYYYGLSTTGKLWFVGNRGYRGMGHTLLRAGYVKWSTREWASLIDQPPTWDTGQLTSQVNQVLIPSTGAALNVETVAHWNDIYPALPSGQMDLQIRTHGNGLKANPTLNQAARTWITANRPPGFYFSGTPLTDLYFSMLFTLDVSDFIRGDEPITFYRNDILQPLEDFDDLDGSGSVEMRDFLGRAIGWLPVDYLYITDPTTGAILARTPLRKRIYRSGSVYYLLVGVRCDILAGLPAGDLIFDPTIDVDVSATTDDLREATSGSGAGSDYWNTPGTPGGGGYFRWWFARWTGITISAGATASNCYVAYSNHAANNSSSIYVNIRFHDSATPATGGTNEIVENRTQTTAIVNWSASPVNGFGAFINSSDISTIIQELVNSYAPYSSGAMALIMEASANSGVSLDGYLRGAAYAPKFHAEYTEGGGAETVTPDDASHAVVSDNVALIQHHVLGAANSAHAITSDNIALVQHFVLSVANASHALTSDNLALIQHHALVVADAVHALTSENIGLVQHQLLIIADATHALSSDNIALIQHQVLELADAVHTLASDNIALVQHQVLAIADAAHVLVSENLVLVQHQVLAIQDAAHALVSDGPTLNYHAAGAIQLVVDDAAHALISENAILIQHQVLVVQNSTHVLVSDGLALIQHQLLVVQDAAHALNSDNLILSYHAATATVLIVQDASHGLFSDNLSLVQHFILVVNSTSHAVTSDQILFFALITTLNTRVYRILSEDRVLLVNAEDRIYVVK